MAETKGQKSIFEFNHIDQNIIKEKLLEIKELYEYYHKQYWCYKKTFNYYKKINLVVNISSIGLIIVGTIVGGVTANPIVLGTISGAGILLSGYNEIKNYKKKIEMSKFAFTTYQKVLVDLRSNLRGAEFNYDSFISEIRIMDEVIIDLCPIIDKFSKQYDKIYF